MSAAEVVAEDTQRDFIRDIVRADLEAGRYDTVVTRFPPSRTATCTSGMPSRSA